MRQEATTAVSEPSCRSTGERIGKDAINALPLFHFAGEVTLVRSEEECARAVEELRRQTTLGFDTETRPSFRKGKTYPPSLIQLATPDKVFLFQLCWYPFGPLLAELFEDPYIIKTGVAVHDDFRFLARLHSFVARGAVNLGAIARAGGVAEQGLRGLAAYFLGVRISKGEQCSNWSNQELTPRQIRYAATDAWVSLSIYKRMVEQGLVLPAGDNAADCDIK